MIVMKFGGTSVKDADAFRRVANIVAKQKDKKVVVVLSACASVTDLLHNAIFSAERQSLHRCYEIIDQLENLHINICNNLFKNESIRNFVIEKIRKISSDLKLLAEGVNLLQECSPRSLDLALSKGEIISTLIFSEYLKEIGIENKLIDAREIIKTDSEHTNAKPIYKYTKKALSETIPPLFEKYNIIITQGFIASDLQNNTTTLGRGGSDFSASIIGAILKAEEVQIWTDVSGILTADPKIVENPKTISQMSFNEVKALSFLGAKVIHPKTILPAMKTNIPVKVLNSINYDDRNYTIISNNLQSTQTIESPCHSERSEESTNRFFVANAPQNDREKNSPQNDNENLPCHSERSEESPCHSEHSEESTNRFFVADAPQNDNENLPRHSERSEESQRPIINSIVLKENCCIIELKKVEQKNKVIKQLKKNKLINIISIIKLFNSALIFLDKISQELKEVLNELKIDTDLNFRECDIICLTGENLFLNKELISISNILPKNKILISLLGINENFLLFATFSGEGKNIVKDLHNKLFFEATF